MPRDGAEQHLPTSKPKLSLPVTAAHRSSKFARTWNVITLSGSARTSGLSPAALMIGAGFTPSSLRICEVAAAPPILTSSRPRWCRATSIAASRTLKSRTPGFYACPLALSAVTSHGAATTR